MTGGTYTLVYEVPEQIGLTVGALGDHRLPAGGYTYTGSALGRGGFSRIERHERVAAGEHDTRHWHVDYLGSHERVRLVDDWRLPAAAVECAVARRLADSPVPGFGASDCDCAAHLARYPDVETAREAVTEAHEELS